MKQFLLQGYIFYFIIQVVKNALECKTTTLGYEYSGFINYTVSGKTCQRWNTDFPQVTYYKELVGDQENYCRNPDNTCCGPWCYTMDPAVRWEFCPVPPCIQPYVVTISPSTSSYTVTETTGSVGPITCTANCLPSCNMTWTGPNIPSGTTSVLNIDNINRNQAGDYHCIAINILGSATSNKLTITVNYLADSVTLSPAIISYTVPVATGFVGPITCLAACVPDCTVLWSGPNLSGEVTPILYLKNVSTNQAGNYQCTAYNSLGSLTSDVVTVIVTVSTVIPSTTETTADEAMTTVQTSTGQTSSQTSIITTNSQGTDKITTDATHRTTANFPTNDQTTSIFPTIFYQTTASSECSCTQYTISSEELQKMIEKLKKELTVDKKTTSAYIRSITCARDNRKSAVAIGICGIVVLCVPVVLFIANDIFSLIIKLLNKK